MKVHYGYKDESGDYFIIVDNDLCDGCGKCINACLKGVFEVIINDYDDLVAMVTEGERRKLKYTCGPCKPTTGRSTEPCVEACTQGAITHSW